ncbi:transglycosylase SLT domain-containing protein [Streptosporangium sp. NPDC048047]|uniref:aggregation-promoting factor C-terminal-like domain-containing protein n=1 Tax=Streptosporangium sp. NPDC048047 TaxID=3155748 RepID=UPI0034275732
MPTLRRTGVLLASSALALSAGVATQSSPALASASRTSAQANKAIGASMVAARGWSRAQFGCLSLLWARESGWNHRAHNRYSGAYGIPQALPGGKMAGAGRDWRTNPRTQIKWGLSYIKQRYGTPCGAWGHFRSHGWY